MIDLRSDTVTLPTEEMRQAMMIAEVGDAIYGDDPTINQLEVYAAQLVGKEAALFVPSGVFGNQLALFTHCNRGDEVIIGDEAHIVSHEGGASAVISGVQLRTLNTIKGEMSLDEIKAKIRVGDYPKTALICMENAYSTGRVLSLDYMKSVYDLANKSGISVHLDGARLFNAATYLKVEAKEITQYTDSVMFCLSKGLCAPIGSILAGSKAFINSARRKRSIMGGGLRQAGVLAAPALIALNKMTKRLQEDHDLATYLAQELQKVPHIQVFMEDVHINLVFFKVEKKVDSDHMFQYFLDHGIKMNGPEEGIVRFVTHYWLTKDNVDEAVKILDQYLNLI